MSNDINVVLGTLVRRIKQRAYLDSDEEIARWIEEYCEQSNSHKQVVMQAEASAGAKEVAARGHIHKWHETSAKERICYMCGETEKTGAGSSHEEQP